MAAKVVMTYEEHFCMDFQSDNLLHCAIVRHDSYSNFYYRHIDVNTQYEHLFSKYFKLYAGCKYNSNLKQILKHFAYCLNYEFNLISTKFTGQDGRVV